MIDETQLLHEFYCYGMIDSKSTNIFLKLMEICSAYTIITLTSEMVLSMLVRNELIFDSKVVSTIKDNLRSIRKIQNFLKSIRSKHEELFMKKMNLLEVMEYWMLEPDKEFINERGNTYHMNYYGLIEDTYGDVMEHCNVLNREWMAKE